jgi:hypothetical protein
MPLTKRSVPCDAILGELLIGAFLLAAAAPAEAGGKVGMADVNQGHYDESRERDKLWWGDEDSPDPVLLRNWGALERANRFDDPEHARHFEEILDGLEQAVNRGFNQGQWNPFRKRDRERLDPETLFEVEAPTIAAPAPSESWMSHFRVRMSSGLEYRQEWPVGGPNRTLQMRIFGPVVEESLGLGFRLDGHVFDRVFQLKAYGGTNEDGPEAGLQFELEF